MSQPWVVISPCGTSLLTHQGSVDLRERISRFANVRSADDVAPADRQLLDAHLTECRRRLLASGPVEASRSSAELKGITLLYGGDPRDPGSGSPHVHLLVASDTWLGQATAEAVHSWLIRDRRFSVVTVAERVVGLRTESVDDFRSALAALARLLPEAIEGYRRAGYRVVFNLTGGFKAIQGFLQVLGLLHADETVYVFESGTELMRIPRLPIRLDAGAAIRRNLSAFRRLSQGCELSSKEASGIEDMFLLSDGSTVILSEWGRMLWDSHCPEIYREGIWPSPDRHVAYGPKFLDTVRDLAPERLRQVNLRIDQLAAYLNNRSNPRSLDVKKVAGTHAFTHECDAWHDGDARRLFLRFQEGPPRTLVIERLGDHL